MVIVRRFEFEFEKGFGPFKVERKAQQLNPQGIQGIRTTAVRRYLRPLLGIDVN